MSNVKNHEKIEILYQDQYLVVINKASGLLSVPYSGSKGRTAQSLLEEILRRQGTVNSKHKPYAVHRLDRDTSGVMMFALTENVRDKIMNTWHTMVKERLYHALAEKNPMANIFDYDLSDSGIIDDAIAQNAYNIGFVPKTGEEGYNNRNFKTVPARTHYKKLLEGSTHVLFELSLDTGKKNQIRAHLAAHGYPLCGDVEHRAKTNPFGRLCLHARTLKFEHPFTKEILSFEVPEPEEWALYVKNGDRNHKALNAKKSYQEKKRKDDFVPFERKLSRKESAHMDFIQRGKAHH